MRKSEAFSSWLVLKSHAKLRPALIDLKNALFEKDSRRWIPG
jgi:hypothetical protein